MSLAVITKELKDVIYDGVPDDCIMQSLYVESLSSTIMELTFYWRESEEDLKYRRDLIVQNLFSASGTKNVVHFNKVGPATDAIDIAEYGKAMRAANGS